MENEFRKVMSQRSDEQLIAIVTVERHKYQPLALEAAEEEIKYRNLDVSNFETLIKSSEVQQSNKKKVDTSLASTFTRFTHLLIDSIFAYVSTVIIIYIFVAIYPFQDNVVFIILYLALAFASFYGYYYLMENKFQKTIGKFMTGTKVVKVDGEKPTSRDIMLRTLCRFIPFDQISFLFMKSGFHDTLTNTKVIKEDVTKES